MENRLLEHVDKEEKAVDKYGISCIVTRLNFFPVDKLSTGKVDKSDGKSEVCEDGLNRLCTSLS